MMENWATDRQRIEAALPAILLFRAFEVCVARAEDKPDQSEMTYDREVLDLLWSAAVEPLVGLDAGTRAKLLKRLDRSQREALQEYESRPVMLVFLMVLFWLKERLDNGELVLAAGSSFDRAMELLIPALEKHDDLWRSVERSAGKNARRFHDVLVGMGYYRT